MVAMARRPRRVFSGSFLGFIRAAALLFATVASAWNLASAWNFWIGGSIWISGQKIESSNGIIPPKQEDPFPPSFDPKLYKKKNRGFFSPPWMLDELHYSETGKGLGWVCTEGQNIRQHISAIAEQMSFPSLEIGPFTNPTMGGEKVKYIDVLDLKGLVERAEKINFPIVNKVEIDFVVPSGDLSAIKQSSQFSMILSSHCIEHQLDLVRHLQQVDRLLVDGGYYVLLVPDKRYCFDHYIAPTTVAEVLDDYQDQRYFAKSHRLKSVIEHRAYTFHGNFWDKNIPSYDKKTIPDRVKSAIKEFEDHRARESYMDVHNYQFTPDSMEELISTLNEMKMINLSVHRIYQTVFNSLEFGVVLKSNKNSTSISTPIIAVTSASTLP